MKSLPKLKEGEVAEYTFRRSQIMNILIIAGLILSTFVFIAFLIYLNSSPSINSFFPVSDSTIRYSIFFVVLILYLVIFLAGLISLYVNRSNILLVTNQRLIQYSATTLLSGSLNIISLKDVEDVSFKQSTLLDHLFHIGQLRLSTVGDETTYTFKHIDSPSAETLSHLSELINNHEPQKADK